MLESNSKNKFGVEANFFVNSHWENYELKNIEISVDRAMNIIIDYIIINWCNSCARKTQVGTHAHESGENRSPKPICIWLSAGCTCGLEKKIIWLDFSG